MWSSRDLDRNLKQVKFDWLSWKLVLSLSVVRLWVTRTAPVSRFFGTSQLLSDCRVPFSSFGLSSQLFKG